MLPAHMKLAIARLDPGSLTALVGGLLSAEVSRLGMPITSLTLSDDITDADEGLDALIEGVPEEPPDEGAVVLPSGDVGFQLKAVRRGKTPSVLSLDDELSKPGPRRILTSGGTYILVWSQDLNTPQKSAVVEKLKEEARKVTDNPKCEVWDAQVLASLAAAHPGVATDAGLAAFDDVWSLPELLSSLHAPDRPFMADDAREQALEKVRERAMEARQDSLVVSIRGDAGVGKTRLAAEALNIDAWRDSVLYVSSESAALRLLTALRRNPSSAGIVVLDELNDSELDRAIASVGATQGRWRLVWVSSRQSSRFLAEGPRDIALGPLAEGATRRLIQEHSGLEENQAVRVAKIAEGFPELAFRLSEELAADPTLDLVTLARSTRPESLLNRLLQDAQARRVLAPLSLFAAVGFEDDLRYEMESVAEVFEIPEDELAHAVSRELGRFVSAAGRYRLVTPLLVAVWLAIDLIERTPGLADAIQQLPESLQRAFAKQLEYFGPGAKGLPEAISRLLDDDRFRSPEDFDEAAGQFLRATAAIVPEAAAAAIDELLTKASKRDLLSLPRRNIVWALEILLWWPETWESAIRSMYFLARHETETWANNASAQFAQFFSVLLSGTTVPFEKRIEWLDAQIGSASEDDVRLLANASAAGLQWHHSRTVTGFRGGGQPEDWRPKTYGELWTARSAAWRCLMKCRDKTSSSELQAEIADHASSALRVMYQSGLWEEVEESLTSRTWTPVERSKLMTGIKRTLRFQEDLPDEARTNAERLLDQIMGEDLEQRLRTVLSSSYWDLVEHRDGPEEPPEILIELADHLVETDQVSLVLRGQGPEDQEDEDTRFRLLRIIATSMGARRFGERAMALPSPDWVAVHAALSIADEVGEGEWATSVLTQALQGQPDEAVRLLDFMELSEARLDSVLQAIEEGRASAEPLARLLYGARLREASQALVIRVVRPLAESGALEHALGILSQWLEVHDDRSEELVRTVVDVGLAALREGGGTMIDHHLREIIQSEELLDGGHLLEWWKARLTGREGLPDELDESLTTAALKASPDEAIALLMDLLMRQARGEGTYGLFASSELALLSRAAELAGLNPVWSRLEDADERTLRWALHHMNWGGHEPDPLVRRFLESDRLEGLENEARVCFFNTLGVVMGPYHRALEGELERARNWYAELRGTTAEQWAHDLIEQYEHDVEWHRQREAEEEIHYR